MMRILPVFFLLFMSSALFSQDLMDVLKDSSKTRDYTTATFKATRIVNGKSVENPAPGNLIFSISHHFGQVNSGAYNFFGLDQSTIRLGFEYGVNNRLALGIGRSTMQKTFDGYFKFKLLRQQTGKRNIPFTVSWLSGIDLNSTKWQYPDRTNYFTSRLSYFHQLMIARKFSNALSFQLTPALVHKNIVPRHTDQNDIFALGFGGRIKLTERLSLNGEYFYLIPGNTVTDNYYNSFSVGIDLETGGHVFQLHFTNSQGMFERGFITETTGTWSKGDIFFGFNITRIFTIIPHDE
jgi:hypothetical protein